MGRIATWPNLICSSLLLGGLSMLAPASPFVDAWHWLRWGRQLAALNLDVTGSWSGWKPLAVPFTTVYATAGDAAPALWVWTSRSAAFMAVGLAAALPVMIARRSRLGDVLSRPAVMAGAATAALLAVRLVAGSFSNGSSEPLIDALLLAGAACAMQERGRTAVGLMLVAGLGRPEALAAAAAMSLFQWRSRPEARVMAVIGAPLVLALWFVPDWLGSGQIGHVLDVNRGWLRRPDLPPEYVEFAAGLRVAARTPTAIGLAVMLSGIVAAIVEWRRGSRYPAAIAASGAAWVGMWVATGIVGSPPMPRYIQPALLLFAGLGGFGVAATVGWLGTRIARRGGATASPNPAAQWGLAAALVALTAFAIPGQIRDINRQANRGRAAIKGLDAVIRSAGGSARIRECGPISRNSEQDGLLAWKLGVDMNSFSASGSPGDPAYRRKFRVGTTFRYSGPGPFGRTRRPADIAPGAKVVARSGGWTVWQACLRRAG